MKLPGGSAVSLALATVLVAAQTAASFTTANMVYRSHPGSSVALPYRLFIPSNYDSSRKYPIILTFHGSGERGTNNTSQLANNVVTPWLQDSVQQREPLFIVSPQCPLDSQWANFWWGATYRINNTPISGTMIAVLSLLDSLKREFSLDTNRFYVSGLSMGGCGTWDIIGRFPTLFAAAIPVCGVGDSTRASSFQQLPIWAAHGAVDSSVPVLGTRQPIAAIEGRGSHVVRYVCNLDGSSPNMAWATLADSVVTRNAAYVHVEFVNGGHGVWNQTYGNPLLPAWLLSKSRAPAAVAIAAPRMHMNVAPQHVGTGCWTPWPALHMATLNGRLAAGHPTSSIAAIDERGGALLLHIRR